MRVTGFFAGGGGDWEQSGGGVKRSDEDEAAAEMETDARVVVGEGDGEEMEVMRGGE